MPFDLRIELSLISIYVMSRVAVRAKGCCFCYILTPSSSSNSIRPITTGTIIFDPIYIYPPLHGPQMIQRQRLLYVKVKY